MEPQYHQQQQQQEDGSCGGGGLANGGKAGGGGGGGAGFLCRQSSTRWIPTSDQIRILRDLYYNNGLRSPNAEQIQRISARLRQYGKIEGKNVFYWFQNHKARERQKKRLTVDVTAAPTTANNSSSSSCCKSTSAVMSPGFPTGGRSSALYNVGHGGNDGSLPAETSFREYCMAGGGMSGVGWGGADSTTSAPWMHHCPSAANAMSREIETLQLFPISAVKEEHAAAECYSPSRHFVAKDGRSSSKNHYTIPSFYCEEQHHHQHHQQQLYSLNGGGNGAETRDLASESLELTLNSYYYSPPDST